MPELVSHHAVPRVEGLGPVESEGRDRVVADLEHDGFVIHEILHCRGLQGFIPIVRL